MSVGAVLEGARHELRVIAGTRRVAVIALLYLGAALIGGTVYVSIVRGVENTAVEVLIQQGNEPEAAAEILELAGEPAFEKVLEFFAGTPIDEMAPSLRESAVLPAFLWCSLAFLPLLVLVTSFDQLASDLQLRSACYALLRVSRSELLLGKLLAHFVAYAIAMAASSLVLVGLASAALSSDPLSATWPGLLRLWALLLPFGLVYLGLTSLASVVARQPGTALAMALGLMVGLRVASWFDARPAGDPLRWIALLSPAHYHDGPWRAGVAGPLTSAAGWTVIAGAAIAVAIWRLGRRDL